MVTHTGNTSGKFCSSGPEDTTTGAASTPSPAKALPRIKETPSKGREYPPPNP